MLNRKYTIYKPRLKHRVKMVNPPINISEGKDIMKMITILILIKQHLLQIYSFFSLIHERPKATMAQRERTRKWYIALLYLCKSIMSSNIVHTKYRLNKLIHSIRQRSKNCSNRYIQRILYFIHHNLDITTFPFIPFHTLVIRC